MVKEGKYLHLSLIMVLLLICGCGGGSNDGNATNMSGVWEGSMIPKKGNEQQIRFELTQDEVDISGEMTLADHQSDDVTGSVEDSTVTISAIFPALDGEEFELGYVGTVDGNTFNGTFDYYLNGTKDDEGAFSLSLDEPVPAQAFAFSFEWGKIPLCTSGVPYIVSNPSFVLTNVPEGTYTIVFNMTDLEKPDYDHGGGRVKYNGQDIIEPGAFDYRSPCPPDGSHRYEWTATAKSIKGNIIGEARAMRDYPE